ncbi:MAG: hypothetical protein WC460_03155 [Patescibacteria group bacterium]
MKKIIADFINRFKKRIELILLILIVLTIFVSTLLLALPNIKANLVVTYNNPINIIMNALTNLVLAALAFILPLVGILISLFPEGIKKLEQNYENEKSSNEKNLDAEIKKREGGIDLALIEKTIKSLKKNKKNAENKLSYLNPKYQILRLSIPLLLLFVITLLSFYLEIIYKYFIIIPISILLLGYFVYVIIKLLEIVMEISKILNDEKNTSDNKIIELLSTLIDKTGSGQKILLEQIFIKFGDQKLEPNKELRFASNKKQEIPISILNSSSEMAKNIQIGLVFPLDFLVEDTPNISSIYKGEEKQIVRFKQEMIQCSEDNHQGNINITFLKDGIHQITAFIKGENVKHQNFIFKIEVVK